MERFRNHTPNPEPQTLNPKPGDWNGACSVSMIMQFCMIIQCHCGLLWLHNGSVLVQCWSDCVVLVWSRMFAVIVLFFHAQCLHDPTLLVLSSEHPSYSFFFECEWTHSTVLYCTVMWARIFFICPLMCVHKVILWMLSHLCHEGVWKYLSIFMKACVRSVRNKNSIQGVIQLQFPCQKQEDLKCTANGLLQFWHQPITASYCCSNLMRTKASWCQMLHVHKGFLMSNVSCVRRLLDVKRVLCTKASWCKTSNLYEGFLMSDEMLHFEGAAWSLWNEMLFSQGDALFVRRNALFL